MVANPLLTVLGRLAFAFWLLRLRLRLGLLLFNALELNIFLN